MEAIALTLALGFVLSGPSTKTATPLVGTWKVQLSQEVRDSAKKMGMPEPQAEFVFNIDKTFAFNSSFGSLTKKALGTYEISDRSVKLFSLTNSWPAGVIGDLKDDHSLDVDGLHYCKGEPKSMAGTWTLRTAAGEDKSIHIRFDKDGSFYFEGAFATSKGHYASDGATVTLTWTEIDGGPVDDGTIHRAYPLNPDGSLQIDSFRYLKS